MAFDHDVRAASWAEHRLGGARAYANSVVLVIGTGIAGALLVGGEPYTAGGYAGEIGHSPVADGPICACGARGCLEAVASAGAIARRYRDATGITPDGARDVIARAAAGDAGRASEIWDSALDALTLSLAQLTAVVAPEAVVIGGGLSRAGDALFDELRTRLAARLSFHRLPVLVPAELSGNAGLHGRRAARQGAHMILTVTPNPALDLTWHVDRLTVGGTHRADAGAARAGGKGLNVARVAHAQGAAVLARSRRSAAAPARSSPPSCGPAACRIDWCRSPARPGAASRSSTPRSATPRS